MLGAAAGAANFLRHGLGTGSREVVEELARSGRAAALERHGNGGDRLAAHDRGAAPHGHPVDVPGSGTPRRAARSARGQRGRPPARASEWASLPSTCTSPWPRARASPRPPRSATKRRRGLDQGPAPTSRASARRSRTERGARGARSRLRKPRSRSSSTVASSASLSGPGARLEQDPAPAAAERDGAQLGVAQPVDRPSRPPRRRAGREPRTPALARAVASSAATPAGDLGDLHVVVVADVRRRAHRAMPSAAAWRPSRRCPPGRSAPSSTPGSRWQCRSITPVGHL